MIQQFKKNELFSQWEKLQSSQSFKNFLTTKMLEYLFEPVTEKNFFAYLFDEDNYSGGIESISPTHRKELIEWFAECKQEKRKQRGFYRIVIPKPRKNNGKINR